eukprot:COSAG01_NODE_3277_length_6316_cov_10.522921_9_plen_105_part_00
MHARYARRQNLAKSPIALSPRRTEVQPLEQPLLQLLRSCRLQRRACRLQLPAARDLSAERRPYGSAISAPEIAADPSGQIVNPVLATGYPPPSTFASSLSHPPW